MTHIHITTFLEFGIMSGRECNFWFPRTQSWLELERNKHSYLWCIYWEEEEGGTQKAWTNKTELELTLLQDMEHLSVFSTHIHTMQHHLHLPYSKIQLNVFCLLKLLLDVANLSWAGQVSHTNIMNGFSIISLTHFLTVRARDQAIR